MENELITDITNDLKDTVSEKQLEKIQEILVIKFEKYQIILKPNDFEKKKETEENNKLVNTYLSAKEIEGCSQRTIKYYQEIIEKLINNLNKSIKSINTEDIRKYLSNYKELNNCNSVTIDNIRRVFSSFFSWLEDEDYIIKSPVRRIHKIKTAQIVKETYTDENIEKMRDKCKNIRNLAMIELLISTGIRVGELVNLNINDFNFEERSCIVFGKGKKQREVYYDARTKIHLLQYINTRRDDNEALFVSMNKPHQRLSISGIELIIRKLGIEIKINRAHPHKFRRTLATMAIDKGMPIEQVQQLLGHVKIETTMHYAMVNQNNVKISHRKYIG